MHTWIWVVIGVASGWIARAMRRGNRAAVADSARTTGAIADLDEHVKRLGEHERAVIMRLIHRERASRDPNAAFEEQMTLGQRLADRVAAVGGSWPFIGVFMLGMAVWITINSVTCCT